MWMFLGLISMLAIFVFVALGVFSLIKKNGKAKKLFLSSLGAFIVLILALSLDTSEPNTDTSSAEEESNEEVSKVQEESVDEKEEEQAAEEAKKEQEEKAKEEAETKAAEEEKAKEEAETKAAEEEKAKEEAEKPDETLSQKNAVGAAENYLDYTAFSKSGLIEQLKYEGFDDKDATYAVNQISVDWREQAVLMAQNYMDYSSFSRSGLIEQLEYEGVSNEDANYAADEIGF